MHRLLLGGYSGGIAKDAAGTAKEARSLVAAAISRTPTAPPDVEYPVVDGPKRSAMPGKDDESASGPYEGWKVPALKRRAQELGLRNYSAKNKGELIKALRDR